MFAKTNCPVILADEQYEVRFVSQSFATDGDLRHLLCEGSRLSTTLREHLGALSLLQLDPHGTHMVPLDGQRVVHCSRLSGNGGSLFMLIVEARRNVDALTLASAKFSLTRRETSVLELVLEGASARVIAGELKISEHTVHAYMKRLIAKTETHNRAGMIATILAWNSSRRPSGQSNNGDDFLAAMDPRATKSARRRA